MATPFLGADEAAWLLALDIDEAADQGLQHAVLALDWKKTYDSGSLDTMATILDRCPLANNIKGPILAMYQGNRRVCIGKRITVPVRESPTPGNQKLAYLRDARAQVICWQSAPTLGTPCAVAFLGFITVLR